MAIQLNIKQPLKEEPLQFDPLPIFPDEIFLRIFSNLKINDIPNISLTCRSWQRISGDPLLWSSLFQRDYPFAEQNGDYKTHNRISSNLSNGMYKTISSHNCPIDFTEITFIDDELIVYLAGSSLCSWNLKSNTIEELLMDEDLSGPLSHYSDLSEKKICSGLRSGEILVLDIKSKNVSVLSDTKQSSIISAIFYRSDKLLTGSISGEIRLWDLKKNVCEISLNAPDGWVTCLAINQNGEIAAGSNWGKITFWNLNNCKCLRVFNQHTGWINSILFNKDNTFVSCSDDKTLKIWNVAAGRCEISYCFKQAIDSLALTAGGKFLSSHRNNTIRVWDIENKKSIKKLKFNKEKIDFLVFKTSGKLCFKDRGKTAVVLDFDVDEEAVLRELADEFEKNRSNALKRFYGLPLRVRNVIENFLDGKEGFRSSNFIDKSNAVKKYF